MVRKIHDGARYPGQIPVAMPRETRAAEYAKRACARISWPCCRAVWELLNNQGMNRSVTLQALALAACFALPLRVGASGARWFDGALVGLEVGPTGSQFGSSTNDLGFAARFRGDEIARAARQARAEYLVIWAREGDWAFYNSKHQPKPPGLGGRDVLREAVEEGRRLGLPVISYCQVQYPTHTLKQHPDWRMVDRGGKPIEGRVCYRSGYLDHMKLVVEEQLAYGVDGFHLDMVDQGFGQPHGCWCPSCQREYQRRHGEEMPGEIQWDEAWDRVLELRYSASGDFERELTSHIRRLNPRASVDYNYHGNPPFSWEVAQRPVQHAGNGDFVTGETGVWGFSALTVGLNAAFYRASAPGQRAQVAMQRGVRMYHDQTTRPLNDMRWELLTLLSHGAFATIVDKTAFDGWLDPVAYGRFQSLFEEVRAKRPHFAGNPSADVGIYFSSRTRDWHGRADPAGWFQCFLGAHKALVYEHVPWSVALDENVGMEALRQLPVLLLPNVAILSPGEVSLLRYYVAEGGSLALTGLTGMRGWRGETNQVSPLEDLIGGRVAREMETLDNHVRIPSQDQSTLASKLAPDGRRDWPFLVRGPAVVLEPKEAAAVGELLKPHVTWLHKEGRYNKDWPISADSPVGPAALLNSFGKGRVLTLAVSPDYATASDHHLPEARRLLSSAIQFLHPTPRVKIEAPATVQAVVADDPASRTLRIHFLAYNAPPQTIPAKDRPHVLPVPIEDTPIYRAKLFFSMLPASVECHNPSTSIKRSGQAVDLLIEDIHEVVVVRY